MVVLASIAPPVRKCRRVGFMVLYRQLARGRHLGGRSAMVANMERITAHLKRIACIAICLACQAIATHAHDLDDFNRAVEAAMSHRRVAAEYLRTGNLDLAVLEIEGTREAWAKVST